MFDLLSFLDSTRLPPSGLWLQALLIRLLQLFIVIFRMKQPEVRRENWAKKTKQAMRKSQGKRRICRNKLQVCHSFYVYALKGQTSASNINTSLKSIRQQKSITDNIYSEWKGKENTRKTMIVFYQMFAQENCLRTLTSFATQKQSHIWR